MDGLGSILAQALTLVLTADSQLFEVVSLSLYVTGCAVLLSALIGLPLGAALGALRFPGRGALSLLVVTLMGLPPVTIGLLVYVMLSASGPLGFLQLLYTPAAMIAAQTILVTPIVAALSAQTIRELDAEYADTFASLVVPPWRRIRALLWDARFGLAVVLLAGFGRAIAEVGAVIIVGGNIAHLTRVMTTTIALETSRGNLELALALGVVLLVISLAVNAAVLGLRARSRGWDLV